MFPIRDHNPSHRFPLITVVLIAINAFVFWLEITAPDIEAFIREFALVPARVNFADQTTLLPFLYSMFMHGGWLHIFSNMWFLWIFGDNIEAHLGHLRYVAFYLIAGLVAAFAQYIIDPSSTIPTLGASGAIAGVLGGYLVLFPRATIETLVTGFGFLHRVNVPATLMLGYWFITQIIAGAGTFAVSEYEGGGVAYMAHIGGFVAGWAMARLIKPQLQ